MAFKKSALLSLFILCPLKSFSIETTETVKVNPSQQTNTYIAAIANSDGSYDPKILDLDFGEDISKIKTGNIVFYYQQGARSDSYYRIDFPQGGGDSSWSVYEKMTLSSSDNHHHLKLKFQPQKNHETLPSSNLTIAFLKGDGSGNNVFIPIIFVTYSIFLN